MLNIIEADEKLSDGEIMQLIFHPGFSTAQNVTSISGRGVGLDVVKKNIKALQGSVEVDSKIGQGTTFRLRLPLTLAIIDGFHVQSSDCHFIIPKSAIVECLDFEHSLHNQSRHCIDLRGEMISYLALRDIFSLKKFSGRLDRERLAIIQLGEDKAGIVVDELHGEVQVVIKPLSPIIQPIRGIGGSTLLGMGEIAFILDIAQLIEVAVENEERPFRDRLIR